MLSKMLNLEGYFQLQYPNSSYAFKILGKIKRKIIFPEY